MKQPAEGLNEALGAGQARGEDAELNHDQASCCKTTAYSSLNLQVQSF